MTLQQFNASAHITPNQIVILDTTDASATNGSLYIQGGLSSHDTFVDGHVMINNVLITPNLDDKIYEQESVLSNNITEWTLIPEFEFNSSVARTFKAHVNINVSTGIPKYAYWEINGLYKSIGGWSIISSFTGDFTGVNFNISTEDGIGKMQYTNNNSSGTTIIRYRATTNAPPGTTPLGAASGIVRNFTGPFTSNTFIYANTDKTLASTDITYNANKLTIGGTSRLVLENANSFQDFSAGGSFTSMGDASIAQKLIVGQKIGIGNTSPSYELDVLGDINFSGYLYQNGSIFAGGGGVSEWLSGTGGNLSYTKGNVGIGTTTPQYKLDVNGTLRATSGITTASVLASTSISSGAIYSTNATSTNIVTTTLSAGTAQFINGITTGSIYANGTIITTDGNVAIGTTSPQSLLHFGSTNISPRIMIYGSDNTSGGYHGIGQGANSIQLTVPSTGSHFIAFGSNSGGNFAEQMRIQNNGNIGIGTTNPAYKLDINGNINVNGVFSNVLNSTTGYLQLLTGYQSYSGYVAFYQPNGTRKGYIGYGDNNMAFQLVGEGARDILISTNNITQMTIASSGNVGIGTNSPVVRLDVRDGGQSTARIYGGSSVMTDWPSGWGGGLNTYDISCAGVYYNVLSQRSDIRKKTNVTTYTRGLSEVLQLRPVSFNWKEYNPTETQYGFIAQEVEQIIPEIVDEDSDGYKNIKHAYIPLLINAIKELNEKIDKINKII